MSFAPAAETPGKKRFNDFISCLCDEYDSLQRHNDSLAQALLASQGLLVVPPSDPIGVVQQPGGFVQGYRLPASERPWGLNCGCPTSARALTESARLDTGRVTSAQLSQLREAHIAQLSEFQKLQRRVERIEEPNAFSANATPSAISLQQNAAPQSVATPHSEEQEQKFREVAMRTVPSQPSSLQRIPEKAVEPPQRLDSIEATRSPDRTRQGNDNISVSASSTASNGKKLPSMALGSKAEPDLTQSTEITKEITGALDAAKLEDLQDKKAVADLRKGPWYFITHQSSDFLIRSFMNVCVISNVIVIGLEADSDWPGWLVVDGIYAFIFTSEVLMRFYKDGIKTFIPGYHDAMWHIFDIALAALQVTEVIVGVLSLSGGGSDSEQASYTWMRAVRLIRICRILRLLELEIFSDLILMVNGAVGGLRTLGWSILLLCLPVYVFALFLNQTIGQFEETEEFDVGYHFSTVDRAMFTGYRCLVIGDCSAKNGTPIFPHIVETRSLGWVYGLAYCLTSVCMTFGLFNVIDDF
jgi:hypothetical protein